MSDMKYGYEFTASIVQYDLASGKPVPKLRCGLGAIPLDKNIGSDFQARELAKTVVKNAAEDLLSKFLVETQYKTSDESMKQYSNEIITARQLKQIASNVEMGKLECKVMVTHREDGGMVCTFYFDQPLQPES